MSDYDFRPGGALKLKSGVQDGGISKKKKKKKHDKLQDSVDKKKKVREEDQIASGSDSQEGTSASSSRRSLSEQNPSRVMTEAEKKFREAKAKRMNGKTPLQATKSHKELVAEFNEKLEALSEHHDIPKVGPG